MGNLSPLQGTKLFTRGIHSYITNRPIVVSYEVALSCNCNCRHCDLGGYNKGWKANEIRGAWRLDSMSEAACSTNR
jgi:MoaA/NifB/PqqE/SkfB family radical SAM enzyme